MTYPHLGGKIYKEKNTTRLKCSDLFCFLFFLSEEEMNNRFASKLYVETGFFSYMILVLRSPFTLTFVS